MVRKVPYVVENVKKSHSNFTPKKDSIFPSSVADPYVFGPPGSGSGSISQRYGSGSGSGSFYHQAKIARKTLISTVLGLFMTFYLCKTMYTGIYLQNAVSRKIFLKNFLWHLGGQ
jgi:hypothetical protein